MIGRRRYRGLGVISNPDGSWQPTPGWCNWMPFADYMQSCTPPTADQVAANNMANVGKSMTPANVEQLKQTWAADAASQCAQNPAVCQQLTDYQNCVAQYGTGFLCNSGLGTGLSKLGIAPEYLPFILAGAGVLLLVIVIR